MWAIFEGWDINTIILLLILMMMFGEYSQRYFKKANWGSKWHIEAIAPVVYYLSGAIAIVLCLSLAVGVVWGLISLIGG